MVIWTYQLLEKNPDQEKEVKTYSKLENKIDDVIKYIKKEINNGNQIFWVCPLIDESNKLDHSSAIQKYNFLKDISTSGFFTSR